MERRLAAILAADVVGYSRLIREDEASTLAVLKAHREELIRPKLTQHHGRMVKLMGDGLLAEFPSAVEAVQCAVELQHLIGGGNAEVPESRRVTYRIGINIGDIVVEDDDIYGDGVNVAARLEGLAEPEGICVSRTVFNHVKDKLDLTFEHLGEKEVKNIAEPVTVYRVVLDDISAAIVTPVAREVAKLKRRWWPVAAASVAALILAVGGALWWQPWKPDVEPASIERMAFPLPDKPSVAVLPFDNLSGDPNQDYFVDGLTETIITQLSRFRSLFVIARDSTFNYKDKPVEVRQAAEELGVQFILEGSVQRSADRLRITAQLIDATTGNHLWAESYDRDLSDIFAVQDEVTESIVASLGAYQGELAEAARERTKRKDPASFSAYDAFLVGMEHKHRFTKADNETAETLFNEAVELDPQFAQAHVGLAWVHIQKFWFGWTDALEQAVAQTREAAEKAIALDPSEAEAHWLLAEAYLADGQFEKSEATFKRALALNPNHADLLAGWGYESVFFGEPERATEFIEKAMRLNPHYPDWYDRGLGTAAYMSRRYEEAIAAFKKVVQHVMPSRLYLAASYAQLGRLEEAQAEVTEAMALDSGISVEKFSRIETYRNPADLEHLRDGLRKAGLRE
jgi:adenylate cyclase